MVHQSCEAFRSRILTQSEDGGLGKSLQMMKRHVDLSEQLPGQVATEPTERFADYFPFYRMWYRWNLEWITENEKKRADRGLLVEQAMGDLHGWENVLVERGLFVGLG